MLWIFIMKSYLSSSGFFLYLSSNVLSHTVWSSKWEHRWFEAILTQWGWVTYICIGKLAIIGSDNGLPPGRRQTINSTNAAILLITPLGTNFSEILIGIQTCSLKNMHFKMSSAKWCPFCLGLDVLIARCVDSIRTSAGAVITELGSMHLRDRHLKGKYVPSKWRITKLWGCECSQSYRMLGVPCWCWWRKHVPCVVLTLVT